MRSASAAQALRVIPQSWCRSLVDTILRSCDLVGSIGIQNYSDLLWSIVVQKPHSCSGFDPRPWRSELSTGCPQRGIRHVSRHVAVARVARLKRYSRLGAAGLSWWSAEGKCNSGGEECVTQWWWKMADQSISKTNRQSVSVWFQCFSAENLLNYARRWLIIVSVSIYTLKPPQNRSVRHLYTTTMHPLLVSFFGPLLGSPWHWNMTWFQPRLPNILPQHQLNIEALTHSGALLLDLYISHHLFHQHATALILPQKSTGCPDSSMIFHERFATQSANKSSFDRAYDFTP